MTDSLNSSSSIIPLTRNFLISDMISPFLTSFINQWDKLIMMNVVKEFLQVYIDYSLHISAIFTYNSPIPQALMTSCCFAHSSPLYAWYDSCSSDRSFASIFFQIPPHDGHPWYWLVVGSCDIAPTVDFHHLDICHARHTKKRISKN